MSEAPTLTEAAAVFAAVEVYHRKMHPRKPRLARDLPRMLDEMMESAIRTRAVTHSADDERVPASEVDQPREDHF